MKRIQIKKGVKEEAKIKKNEKAKEADLKKKRERKNKIKKVLVLSGLFILLLIPLLSLIRIISPAQIDDLHPLINCPEIQKYNFGTVWVIPMFEGVPISKDPEWCEMILSLNKTIGLHGYTHSYKEFGGEINSSEIEEAIEIFEECFGFKPSLFKPPHLAISRENRELIKEYNLSIRNNFNQITHKIYHCNEGGVFPNWIAQLL